MLTRNNFVRCKLRVAYKKCASGQDSYIEQAIKNSAQLIAHIAWHWSEEQNFFSSQKLGDQLNKQEYNSH